MERKVFIRTFGCQMNKYDSEVMGNCLLRDGYLLTNSEEEADVVLLNTCSVREHAERRVAGVVNSLKRLKDSRPDLILGICGCMAQKDGERLMEKFPHLDLVCGTHRFTHIADVLRQAIENGKPVVDIRENDETGLINRRIKPAATQILRSKASFATTYNRREAKQALPLQTMGLMDQSLHITGEAKQALPLQIMGLINQTATDKESPYLNPPPQRREENGRFCAWVSVMRGCDSYCSYCVVPFLRGRERSRPSAVIIKEIEHLAGRGVKEVCLLGQNIVAYGKGLPEKIDFAGLLEKVNAVKGISRIRFLTSHPRDVGDKLLERVKELEEVCESLHFPLQAGSDKILKLMNRGYTRDYYRKLIEKARSLMPDAGITTDIIVGFPGETDEDFKETRELMKEIEFDDAFIYRYSPRPGTSANLTEDDVPDKVKQERLEVLLELQRTTSNRKNKKLAGREVEVLVEEVSRKDPSSLYGKTRTDKNVVFKGGRELIGKMVNVKIEKTGPATLVGKHIK